MRLVKQGSVILLIGAALSVSPVAAAAPPAERSTTGLFLGAGGGGYTTVAKDLSVNWLATLEVGYRFPWIERAFGISLAPSYLNLHPTQGTTKSALAITIPLIFSINFILGPGLFRAGGGPLVAYAHIVSADTFVVNNDQSLGWGVQALVAYLYRLPVGAVGLQLDYRLLPYTADDQPRTSDLLSAALMFLVDL